MMPGDANILGKVFGGRVLALIDKAAATAAMRHAGGVCVTAQIDRVTFAQPIEIGNMARFVAEVTYVGRSSLEVRVEVFAMNLNSGEERATNTCYVTLVAVDEEGRPRPVPRLECETADERARYEEGRQRMEERRRRRKGG
ncbi:MAG: acyl-CoA thioesterase [Planctomycetota bacterium]|nr:MAG: acyl-CoA thioesterase [Planctomycetota bacterium]